VIAAELVTPDEREPLPGLFVVQLDIRELGDRHGGTLPRVFSYPSEAGAPANQSSLRQAFVMNLPGWSDIVSQGRQPHAWE
jgi:hypothetical protein